MYRMFVSENRDPSDWSAFDIVAVSVTQALKIFQRRGCPRILEIDEDLADSLLSTIKKKADFYKISPNLVVRINKKFGSTNQDSNVVRDFHEYQFSLSRNRST